MFPIVLSMVSYCSPVDELGHLSKRKKNELRHDNTCSVKDEETHGEQNNIQNHFKSLYIQSINTTKDFIVINVQTYFN